MTGFIFLDSFIDMLFPKPAPHFTFFPKVIQNKIRLMGLTQLRYASVYFSGGVIH
jgi:hypothetical protein